MVSISLRLIENFQIKLWGYDQNSLYKRSTFNAPRPLIVKLLYDMKKLVILRNGHNQDDQEWHHNIKVSMWDQSTSAAGSSQQHSLWVSLGFAVQLLMDTTKPDRGKESAMSKAASLNKTFGEVLAWWCRVPSPWTTALTSSSSKGTLPLFATWTKCFEPVVAPFMEAHHDLREFMDDNVRCRTACLKKEFLAEEEIQVMPWTPHSPDLNPIEHLLDVLGRHVALREPHNHQQLGQFL